MVRFGVTEIAKKKFYAAKKSLKIWDVNVDNIVISKLVKTKTNSKYLIGYLDKAIVVGLSSLSYLWKISNTLIRSCTEPNHSFL